MAQTQLTDDDVAAAAAAINVDVAALRAVIEVECAGSGFIPDGRPTILYEAHIFHRETNGRFDGRKDRHGVALSVSQWDKSLYGAGGAHQHERLEDAAKLDWDGAHKACSWGMGQVMGTNHKPAGQPTIKDFVDAMHDSAGKQLDAMVAFIQSSKLDAPLRRHDWASFARGYNGSGYAQNQYDKKLEQAWRKWSSQGTTGTTSSRPTLRVGSRGDAVRDVQRAVGVAADGSFGPATEQAVKNFQLAHNLTADGIVGPATWAQIDQKGG